MAGRELDSIPAKADIIVKRMDQPENDTLKSLYSLQSELRGISPADSLRLLEAIDKKENKSVGDNLEIVDTRDGKVVILTGKGGEALVGTFKK